MKRSFDLFFSLLVIPFLVLPVLIFLILSFISTGKFPVISQERRISLNKKRITIYKIRTIKYSQNHNISKSKRTVFYKTNLENDVPVFCKWLRKTGIDESLQLFNILKGEMSFVGPRPLIQNDLDLIKKDYPHLYERRNNLNAKPGLTGYWQIFGNREKGVRNLIELDEHYEKNKSPLLDLKILLKSFIVLLTAKHSDSIVGENFLRTNQKISAFNPLVNSTIISPEV